MSSNLNTGTSTLPQVLISQQMGTTDAALYTVPAVGAAKVGMGTVCSVGTTSTPTLSLGTTSTTGGGLASGTYYWKVTAKNAAGESLGSNEVTASFAAGTTTGSQVLTWTTLAGAVSYNVYRGTAAGTENVLVDSSTNLTYTDLGNVGAALTSPPNSSSFAFPVVINLSVIKSGGVLGDSTHRVLNAYPLAANGTLSLATYLTGHYLGAGDVIAGFASTSGAVVVLSGVVFS